MFNQEMLMNDNEVLCLISVFQKTHAKGPSRYISFLDLPAGIFEHKKKPTPRIYHLQVFARIIIRNC
jgi:hypothetical protein